MAGRDGIYDGLHGDGREVGAPEHRRDLGEQMRLAGLRKENARAWQEVDRLRGLLGKAREKLMVYRREYGGEYKGGPEYSALMKEIDSALKIVSHWANR